MGTLFGLVSGCAIAALGIGLISLRPRRPEQIFFGLFALTWGAIFAAANAGVALESLATQRAGLLVSAALGPVAGLFLLHAASRGAGVIGTPPWSVVFGALAVSSTTIMLLDPALFVSAVPSLDQRPELGPAAVPLSILPLFAAFYIAISQLYGRYRRADVGTPRHRVRGLLLALCLFASYQSVARLISILNTPFEALASDAFSAHATRILAVAGCAFLAALTAHLLLRPPHPERRDRWLIAALVVPASVAVLEEVLVRQGVPIREWGSTWGVWRLLAVAIIVHTIARHRLFDLDLKLKWAFRQSTVTAVFFGVFFVASETTQNLVSEAWGPYVGIAAAGVLLVALAPVQRFAKHVADRAMPSVEDTPQYVSARKLDVYAATLDKVLEDGVIGPEEDAWLANMRRTLGVTSKEHDRLMELARAGRPGHAQEGVLVAGRYRIGRLLGEGAHGRAFLAHDERADRSVVVKVVGTRQVHEAKLLMHEADVLRKLDHPNVVRVLDALEAPHEVLLVTEYAGGGSLASLLARRGRLPARDALRMLDELLAGLCATHEQGVVHRDVKPENVLLAEGGSVKLADFGIARAAGDAGTTLAGPAGTLLYMAPEQVRGLDADARSDLYAAAAVGVQTLTGRHYLPIAGRDDYQIRQLILTAKPRLALGAGLAAVERVLVKALAKDPAARYASAAQMREALAAASSRVRSRPTPSSLSTPSAR